jgi:hypothetical protein
MIEVNDNIVGESPLTIPQPRKKFYPGTGVEAYQGMRIRAIPTKAIQSYAQRFGGIAMPTSKLVNDPTEVSHVHLETWFADPEKLQKSRQNSLEVNVYNR